MHKVSLKRLIFYFSVLIYTVVVCFNFFFLIHYFKRNFIENRKLQGISLLKSHINDIVYGTLINNKTILNIIENNLKTSKFVDYIVIKLDNTTVYSGKINKKKSPIVIHYRVKTKGFLNAKGKIINILMGINIKDYNRYFKSYLKLMLFLLIFSTFIFGFFIYLIIYKFFNVINDISEGMEVVSRGKFEKLNIKVYKEFKPIIKSFNKMIDALIERDKEIKEKILAIENMNKILKKQLAEIKALQQIIIMREKLVSLGTITAGIAHEINNPVSAIRGLSELTLLKLKDNTLKEIFEKIIKYCDRIKSIIQTLKVYGRQSVDIEKKWNSLKDIINDAIEMAKNGKIIDKVQIKGNFKDYKGKIYCKRDEILQVFLNLITNSAEAMKGEGEINIDIEDSEDFIEVHFRDSGPGIPEEISDRIFEPFLTTKEKGTGLGLYICYRIILNHDGEIYLEKSDRGAYFIIRFKKVNPDQEGS